MMCNFVRVIFVLPIVILVSATCAAASGPKSDKVEAILSVRAQLIQDAGHYTLRADVENQTSEFLCIESTVFLAEYQHVLLKDKRGEFAQLKAIAEPDQDIVGGVNYAVPYFMIRPHEAHVFHINLERYVLHRGRYTYKVSVPHYYCKDIIDPARLISLHGIIPFGVTATGEFSIEQ
jgi:hypothetical protein